MYEFNVYSINLMRLLCVVENSVLGDGDELTIRSFGISGFFSQSQRLSCHFKGGGTEPSEFRVRTHWAGDLAST